MRQDQQSDGAAQQMGWDGGCGSSNFWSPRRGEALRGWVFAAEGDRGRWGHSLPIWMCEKKGRCVTIHIHIWVAVCVNVLTFRQCEATEGLQETEGMSISALADLAKDFWGPPSHLVGYLYLDQVGVITQVRKTFSFRKIGMAFLLLFFLLSFF